LSDVSPETDTNIFQPDFDPFTITDALDDDSDDDGWMDGVEDANHNGRVDAGETNPNQTGRNALPWLPPCYFQMIRSHFETPIWLQKKFSKLLATIYSK